MFHKEGFRIIISALIVTIVLSILSNTFIQHPTIRGGIMITLLIFLMLILQFFRNPKRNFLVHDDTVLSPVDGKVVVIKRVFEKEYLQREVMQVSIFMSPLNVHVCRYPLNGIVKYVKYHAGKYLVAFHPKSSELNERTTTVVEAENKQEVLFRQIAGAMAKRIVIYAKEGDEAEAGKEYGFIKFGSRLDVFLPLDAKIFCKLGDKPKGAVTKIAELRS